MAEIYFGNLAFGQQLVLQDGDIAIPESPEVVNDGSILVAAGASATLELGGYLLKGDGKIFADETAALTVSASDAPGQLQGMTLTAGGHLTWVGQIQCDDHFVMESYAGVNLQNPLPRRDDFVKDGQFDEVSWRAALETDYPYSRSVFVMRSGYLTGTGVFNGNLQLLGGQISLQVPPTTPKEPGCVEMPAPSPDFIVITGDVTMASGVMEVAISADYYGQLAVTGTCVLGSGQLNITLQSYTPAYTDAYRIIKCDNITGQFGTFNSTCMNFDNKGIIAITGGKAYRLSGY